jgi:cytochrome c553
LKIAPLVLALFAAAPLVSPAEESAHKELSAILRAKPNQEHGASLFRDCAVCHGTDGNGAVDGTVPRIGGQHFRVLVNQLVAYRHETRWDVRMEHYAGRSLLANEQDIADVAAYAASLSPSGPLDVGDGALVNHGKRLYADQCASCHGASAEGDDRKAAPRLAGQHYGYLLRQMYDAVDGRRPNFSGDHIKRLAKLDRDDLVGVADYLSRTAVLEVHDHPN